MEDSIKEQNANLGLPSPQPSDVIGKSNFPPPTTKKLSRPKNRFGITYEDLLKETTEEERNALRLCLDSSIISFIEDNLPVYLERLGIIFPDTYSKLRIKSVGQNNLVYTEKIRSIKFEKCSELVSYHREVHPGVVGTRELASLMYPRISSFVSWDEKEIQRYLKGYLLGLRDEVVIAGKSASLETVGTLFSLHNRQGQTLLDWYAGADIFLSANYKKIIEYGDNKIFPRPIFDTAWEPMESQFGPSIEIFEIDLVKEISDLQCGPSENRDACVAAIEKQIQPRFRTLPVAIFRTSEPSDEKNSYIFVTDSARLPALFASDGAQPGVEITFQLELEKDSSVVTERDLAALATPILVVAWILLNSSSSKILREGMGIDSSESLLRGINSPISAIICTKLTSLTAEQLTPEGPFKYINVVGITESEASACAKLTPEYLIKVLRHKKLDQVTRPIRLSVLHKTGFENT